MSAVEFTDGFWADFGDRVQELRKARGYTQAELIDRLTAYKVVMHPTTLAKLERGKRPATVHELRGLAGALRCDYVQLMPPRLDESREVVAAAAHKLEVAREQVERKARALKLAMQEFEAVQQAEMDAQAELVEAQRQVGD